MPGEALAALETLRLCERFGCLPSQLMAEDAGLLRMLDIEAEVRGPDE